MKNKQGKRMYVLVRAHGFVPRSVWEAETTVMGSDLETTCAAMKRAIDNWLTSISEKDADVIVGRTTLPAFMILPCSNT